MKPYRVFLFLAVCLVVLGMVFWFFPEDGVAFGGHVWRMPDVKSEWRTEWDTIPRKADTVCILFLPELIRNESPYETIDTLRWGHTYRWLQPFYASLPSTDSTSIRVVHYGDSQIEGDRMTMILRSALQARFGGSGVGLTALYQPIESRTWQQSLCYANTRRQAEPTLYRVYGSPSRKRAGRRYGPMGQVVVMDNALQAGSEDLTLTLKTDSAHAFSRLRLVGRMDSMIECSDTVTHYSLRLQGKKDVYGVSMECATGIYVDNIAMRGCSGTIFTGIDSVALKDYFATTDTRLLILQFGGNVVPYLKTDKQITHYVNLIRRQLRYLHRCAPEAAILFVGPSDMARFSQGEYRSYPVLPLLDEALRQAAEEEQTAYWSLYEAMGGEGSMRAWMQNGLAGRDGIHFSRSGSDKAGEMLTAFVLQPISEDNEW